MWRSCCRQKAMMNKAFVISIRFPFGTNFMVFADPNRCWSLTLFRRLIFSRLFKCISHVLRELQFKPSDWNRPVCGGDASTGLLRRAVCVGEAEMGGAINPSTECRMLGERDGRLPLSLHLPFLDENCLSKCKRVQLLCFKGQDRERGSK